MPAARLGSDATGARDARRLSTLLEVSQALSGTLNFKSALQRVLVTLMRHHSVIRGMVTLVRDGELHEGSNWEAAMCAAHYRLVAAV